MASEKRLIDANALLRNNVWLCGGAITDPYSWGYMDALDKVEIVIRNAPTVDAVEVALIKEVSKKILETLDNLIAADEPLANDTAPSSYYRGKVNAYEVARRLVNAALNELCNHCGAKMDA